MFCILDNIQSMFARHIHMYWRHNPASLSTIVSYYHVHGIQQTICNNSSALHASTLKTVFLKNFVFIIQFVPVMLFLNKFATLIQLVPIEKFRAISYIEDGYDPQPKQVSKSHGRESSDMWHLGQKLYSRDVNLWVFFKLVVEICIKSKVK